MVVPLHDLDGTFETIETEYGISDNVLKRLQISQGKNKENLK